MLWKIKKFIILYTKHNAKGKDKIYEQYRGIGSIWSSAVGIRGKYYCFKLFSVCTRNSGIYVGTECADEKGIAGILSEDKTRIGEEDKLI